MDLEYPSGSAAVIKRARTAGDRWRLAREAQVLGAAAHPGVVRLHERVGGDPPTALVLGRVLGAGLEDLGPQPQEVVAGIGASLATIVADLHDIGVAHGALSAGHVLLDADGRPVLCSFGAAVQPASVPDCREDVRALAVLLLGIMPAGASKRTTRSLKVAAGRGRLGGGDSRGPGARWLARRLVESVPGACLPSLPFGEREVEPA
ncbi:MAG: hypothetical protein ACRDYY_15710, partial [Acidimicrobiales bacterium]